jgi:hypothetical protein
MKQLHTLKAPLIIRDGSTVIIEIGSAYTKCGIAGESAPRKIIRNPRSLTLLMIGYHYIANKLI